MTPTTHALLVCVIFLCGLEETVLSKRGVCTENQCLAIFEEPENFSSAQQRCEEWSGKLFEAILKPEQESLLTGLNGSYWFDNEAAVGGQKCSSVSGLAGLHVTVQPCQNTLDGFLCQFQLDKACNSRQADGGAQMKYFAYAGFELEDLKMFPTGAIAVMRTVGAEYPGTKHICLESSWMQAPWSCEVNNGGCEHKCDSVTKSCICPAGHKLHPNGISCMKNPCPDCAEGCNKVGNTYVCSCGVGYSLAKDGKNCVDDDVCRGRCKGGFEECVRSGGSFECRCKDGFTLAKDGKKCVEDVCKKKNPCQDDSEECVNTGGSYECMCKEGWEREDGKCINVSICMKCEHLRCAKINGSYTCLCREGFKVSPKDPTKCVIHCTERDCRAHCAHSGNVTQCFCPDGYVADVQNGTDYCTDIDECESQEHCPDRECVNTYGGYRCQDYDDYGSGSNPPPASAPLTAQPASVQPATLPYYVKTGSILGITLFFALSATLLICMVRYMVKRCGKLELSSFKGPDMDIFYLQQVTTETYKRLSFDKQCKNDSQIF